MLYVYIIHWIKRKKKMKKASKKYQQNIVKLSYGMSAKMDGILSLSTSCEHNERCMRRYNLEKNYHLTVSVICSNCFAMATIKARTTVANAMRYNAMVLQGRLLSDYEINLIATEIVMALLKNGTNKLRLESFGDIANTIHATNYINLCSKVYTLNHSVRIAWWTKNIDILIEAWENTSEDTLQNVRKNTNIILSSVFVDIPMHPKFVAKVESILKMSVMVFTVERHKNEKTNCGAKSCLKCGFCYRKHRNTEWVFEVLK